MQQPLFPSTFPSQEKKTGPSRFGLAALKTHRLFQPFRVFSSCPPLVADQEFPCTYPSHGIACGYLICSCLFVLSFILMIYTARLSHFWIYYGYTMGLNTLLRIASWKAFQHPVFILFALYEMSIFSLCRLFKRIDSIQLCCVYLLIIMVALNDVCAYL